MSSNPASAKPVTAALIARSVLFAAGQGLLSVIFSIAAVLALLLPYRLRYALVSHWSLWNLWWLEFACGLNHRIVGMENAPGQRRRYRQGGALLAEKTGYPVLPVAHNAGEFWPRNSFIKYPGTIDIAVGPLIHSAGRGAADINHLAEDWIETAVEEIRHRPNRGDQVPSATDHASETVEEHTQRV